MIEVYTLLVEVGRKKDDGLPQGAIGGAFLLFTPAKDEQTAVNDSVRLLREAGLNPLEVSNLGTIAERAAEGYDLSDDEHALADEALRDGSVIILDKQVYFDEEDDGVRN